MASRNQATHRARHTALCQPVRNNSVSHIIMSSSKKKAILTIGGLSLTGALGAWVYNKFKDYDEDNPEPPKPTDKVKKSDLRLKQVQVIFRHGARTPIHLIPNVEEVPLLHILIFFFSFHMS